MLKIACVAVIALSLGVYAIALVGPRPSISLQLVEKLNLIHLAALYLAIVVYVINSIKRFPYAGLSCVSLLLISSYTGIVVEMWRFVGVVKGFIPPFVFVLTCAESTRALCNHFSSIEISVPLITAFISLCWGIYKLVSLRHCAGAAKNASEVEQGPKVEDVHADRG